MIHYSLWTYNTIMLSSSPASLLLRVCMPRDLLGCNTISAVPEVGELLELGVTSTVGVTVTMVMASHQLKKKLIFQYCNKVTVVIKMQYQFLHKKLLSFDALLQLLTSLIHVFKLKITRSCSSSDISVVCCTLRMFPWGMEGHEQHGNCSVQIC